MREYNKPLSPAKKIGFYGLDVYSLWESMELIVEYLEKVDPNTAEYAKRAVDCFEPYGEDDSYGTALESLERNCKEEVVELLKEVRLKAPQYDHDPEAGFNAEMNALVTRNAEKYYSAMSSFGDTSRNVRDLYMADDGLLNVGQLVREQHKAEEVVLVGFGSYEGSVIAGRVWGGKMQEMKVPPATANSVEAILHADSAENKLLIFNENSDIKEQYKDWLKHRAIVVVYHPSGERGNYVPTKLSSRYDAFLYLDKTKALHPLGLKPDGHKTPETFPFGI